MTRLGWLLLIGFAIIIAGFVAVVRKGAPVTADRPERPAASSLAIPPSAGGLVVPVAGIAPGQLTDSWGDPRENGQRAHHAIDIMAARGTPVLAAAGGRIEKVFESRNGGHTIYIRRSDPGWIDYYAHLDAYAPDLREGMAVRRGQTIGAVGSSGDANPAAPHLHYEIKRMGAGEKWWQGENINPYPILHR